DAGPEREVRRALLERQEIALVDVDRALARDRETGPRVEDRLGPLDRGEEVVLAGLEGHRDAGPPHDPVARPVPERLLLRTVEVERNARREGGEHDRRVGPAQVV